MTFVLEPPAIYDHPFPGTVIEHVVPGLDLLAHCWPYFFARACSFHVKGKCYIYYSREEAPAMKAAIRRHEEGHCNGWPADHPGGRKVPVG